MNFAALKSDVLANHGDLWARGDAAAIAALYGATVGWAARSRFVNARTVLAELGSAGAVILDKLEAVAPTLPPVKWAMRFLTTEMGIDVGHPTTQGMIAQLQAGGVLTGEEAQALAALAEHPVTLGESLFGREVTEADIIKAFGNG